MSNDDFYPCKKPYERKHTTIAKGRSIRIAGTEMPNLNLSGSLNVLRLFANPALCLPHHTVSSFDKIPVPLSEAFQTGKGEKKPDIRAVVLDKDNCFAVPHQNEIFPSYKTKFDELRKAYPGSKLLIVSNSSGTGADPGYKDAELLENNTGVTVLRHATKKPGCHGEIMDYFRSTPDSQVTRPDQVAIVGDRLFTDMLMANMMGAHSVWVRDGVVEDRNILARFEKHLSTYLFAHGYTAPNPRSDFE